MSRQEFLNSERWTQIDDLFDAALQFPESDRTAFLRTKCGEDLELYNAVVALLEFESSAASHIGESATDFAANLLNAAVVEDESLPAGSSVGRYTIIEELGRGGMGVVYRARRSDGAFDKLVAVKLVKRGMDTDEVLRRFQFERQVLAGLDHPNIARVLDAGAHSDGRPFLVMELAQGEPITTFARERNLTFDERLDLFAQMCEAVRYAHRNLVVHRDLKPSNVLATVDDTGEPRLKLLDFGIAKLIANGGPDPDELTGLGIRPHTPRYAAPEQVKGHMVTTATDVYALGVILHQLAAEALPVAPGLVSSSALKIAPSHLRPDLAVLLQKSMHEEPSRRYGSAEELLQDLHRFRRGLPLAAQPDSATYRLRKFVTRNRRPLSIAAGVLGLSAVFLVALLNQRGQAREASIRADEATAYLGGLYAAADPMASERLDTLRVRDLLAHEAIRVRENFADQPETRASLQRVIGATFLRLGLYPQADSVLGEAMKFYRANPSNVRSRRRHVFALEAFSHARRETGHAEQAYELALEAARLAAEEGNDSLVASAAEQQALALRDLGRNDEAETVIRSALENALDLAPPLPSPTIVNMEMVLGGILLNQMRLDDSEKIYRSALARIRAMPERDLGQEMNILRNLTFMLLVSGNAEEAVKVGKEAVAISRARRAGSGSLAQILAIYGSALRRNGRLDEAVTVLREAAALPPRRPQDRAVPLGTLANVLLDSGDADGAEAAQREAYQLLVDANGTGDLTTIFSAVKLGDIWRAQNRYEEAEQLLLDAYEQVRNDSTSHGSAASRPAAALSRLYSDWGRQEEADRWRAKSETR